MKYGIVDRLAYMLKERTQSNVSQLTGIPQSTISYVARGLRDLPAKYEKSLRNEYQKTTYRDLKSVIPNSTFANRWKWYSPHRVEEIIAQSKEIVSFLTAGAVANYFSDLGRNATEQEINTALPAFRQRVLAGLADSPKSYEDWNNYPGYLIV